MDERNEAIKILYENGSSLREIGQVFGLSAEGVRVILKKMNVTLRTSVQGMLVRSRLDPLVPTIRERQILVAQTNRDKRSKFFNEAAQRYKAGESLTEIAASMGTNYNALYATLRARGLIDVKPRKGLRKRSR